ncbi:MAG: hypothetical protein LUE24_01820 [Lachnospiraceae bacterium]|nr:hypothetical protein [Lachnospiraceae bacterium]
MEPREVTSDEAAEIILNKSEEGLFYLYDEPEYVGIVCKDGTVTTQDFESRFECLKWLRERA